MNKRIIQFLEDIMSKKDISCASLAQLTGIAYRRLLMVFVWREALSGSELLCICRALEVKQNELMGLLDSGSQGKMTETGGMNGSDNSKKGSEDKEEKIRQNEPGKIKGTAVDTVDCIAGTDFPVYIQLFTHVWNQHRF